MFSPQIWYLSCCLCSSPEGPNPSISLRYQPQLPGRWRWRCRARSHWGGLLQRAASVRAHLPAPPGWAVPQQPLRDPLQSGTDAGICERSPRHGHRQHLWAGRPTPLQHHRVGKKHPVLPRVASLRAGESRHTCWLITFSPLFFFYWFSVLIIIFKDFFGAFYTFIRLKWAERGVWHASKIPMLELNPGGHGPIPNPYSNKRPFLIPNQPHR